MIPQILLKPVVPLIHLSITTVTSSSTRGLSSLLKHVLNHKESLSTSCTAILDGCHRPPGGMTFSQLDSASAKIASAVSAKTRCLPSPKVSLLCPNSSLWPCASVGVWRANSQACLVPLCTAHPQEALQYYVKDSGSTMLLASKQFKNKAGLLSKSCKVDVVFVEDAMEANTIYDDIKCDKEDVDREAMIVYTSGTTGPPKGTILTEGNLTAQASAIAEAWGWKKEDRLLHVLPLHHVHGIVNCLITPLSVGASVDILPKFDEIYVWEKLLRPSKDNRFRNLESLPERESGPDSKITLFMAVPTVYAKLLSSFEGVFPDAEERSRVKDILRRDLRLMVSGSAALPEPILESWRQLSGHVLLERYGMTEIGMALTNPLNPESDRRPGRVGRPFPNVQVRIVKTEDDGSKSILATSDNKSFSVDSTNTKVSGDLQVKGPNVFRGYHGRPEATAKEFDGDKWFRTGDAAEIDPSDGSFKILGRTSVDIIKSGGYKISALDVEKVLLENADIADVAVLGTSDTVWGQVVSAVVVPSKPSNDIKLEEVQSWCESRLPPYSMPRRMKLMLELPRNQMGKVNKKELVKIAFPQPES